MSVIGVTEALSLEKAKKANKPKIAADAILYTLTEEVKLVFGLDTMTNKELLALRNKMARIIREVINE